MEKEKLVDVIIPVYKPDKKLEKLLERLNKQTKKPNRIILLHTEDGTKEERKSKWKEIFHAEIFPVSKEKFDHGGTRDYGAFLSNAFYLLFLTQDALPADIYLIEKLTEPFKNKKIAAVYARQLARKNADKIEQYTRLFNYPDKDKIKSKEDLERLGIKTYFCSNVCAVYRADIYRQLGGFEKQTIFNEDMIFASKIIHSGYQIYYRAKAKVIHSHQYSYFEQFQRNFDLGVSQTQYKTIFENVPSEKEGKKFVKDTICYFLKKGKLAAAFDFILQSSFKYAGYKLGKQYKRLPKWLVVKYSMNKGYWRKDKKYESAFK